MAKYWLINTVLLATGKKLPGDSIDDTVDNVAAIQSAGGVLWPFADSIVADAAAKAQVARLGKAVNEQELFNSMNAACQDSTNLSGKNKSPNVSQAIWYIKPVGGNDNASGKTTSSALKTWKEWRTRVGELTTLSPTGGLLRIYILGDMPITDPIFFTNQMGQNCSCIITGTKKLLASGVISSKQDKDRTINQHYSITDSSKANDDFFEAYIGKSVEIYEGSSAVGSRAFIARNMNQLAVPVPKSAHMSNWMAGAGEFLDIGPGDTPVALDKYRIYDYSKVSIGALESKGVKCVAPDVGNSFQSVQLINVSVENVAGPANGDYFEIAMGPTTQESGLIVTDSIFRTNQQIMTCGRNLYYANVSTQGNIKVHGDGWFWYIGGCHQPQFDIQESGSLDCLSQASSVFIGADPTFVGKNGGDKDASLNGLGNYYAGPFSVWDSFHTALTQPGSKFYSGLGNFFFGDPWTGETDGVPFWGTGNTTEILVAEESIFYVSQIKFTGNTATWTLPTVDGGPGTSNFLSFSPAAWAIADQGKYYKWDAVAGANVAPPVNAPFSAFDVGGAFATSTTNPNPDVRITVASAFQPAIGSRVTFGLIAINP
jgi:hypothetical protein